MKDEILQRLERIEEHVAHLERQVEQLNGVIVEQGRSVEQARKQLQQQAAVLETLEWERIKGNTARPPHH